jgi:hypothetical protein
MGRDSILIYVDERRPIFGRPEAAAIRHCPDENKMSVLDGFHVDLIGYALLSASARVLQTAL